MTAVLGIDGGGSHTRAAWVDREGRVVATAIGASINPRHHDLATVGRRLAELVAGKGEVAAAFLSLGGISTRADGEEVEAVAQTVRELRAARVRVDNDAVAALAGGLAGRPGMVLIAGTGSACFGVAADGRQYWCGGWEYVADDAGSAWWLAVEAVRMAVRMHDGRLPRSALHELVFARLGQGEPRTLPRQLSQLDRAGLAALAPAVIALAATDVAAAQLLDRAADELAGMVAVTAARLFAGQPCELIYTGGLARSGPPFSPLLTARIGMRAPSVAVVEPELPPVLGAALEAARLASWSLPPQFLPTLRSAALHLP